MLNLRKSEKIRDIVPLVSSGFKRSTPQLLIPRKLAKNLRVWPYILPQAKIIGTGLL